jgi:GTP-binding protein EngB required for normal cell division
MLANNDIAKILVAAKNNDLDTLKSEIEKEHEDLINLKLITNNNDAENGFTPLHFAVAYKHDRILTYLLNQTNKILNINMTDNRGRTALYLAVEQHNLEIARKLLYHGAKIKLPTQDALNPLDIAKQQNNQEMVVLLELITNWDELESTYKVNCRKILGKMEEIFSNIAPAYNKNLVMFIGNTGAGKSTTINYLLGHHFKNYRDKAILEPVPGKPQAAIGYSVGESQTIYPSVYEHGNVRFCDTPGFKETRDDYKVATTMSMRMIGKLASQIQSLMIVIDYRSFEVDKGASLKDLMSTLGLILKNPEADSLEKSIGFIITKKPIWLKDSEVLIAEAIDPLIKTTRGRLEQLSPGIDIPNQKRGYLKGAWSFIKSGVKNVVRDLNSLELQQVEEQRRMLALLYLMKENPNNIFIIDVFEPDSKEKIEEFISRSTPLNPGDLTFSQHDKIQVKFDEVMAGAFARALQSLDKYINLPGKIKDQIIEKEECATKMNFYTSQIEALQRKDNTKVIDVTLREQEKQNFLRMIEKNEKKIKQIESRIARFPEEKETKKEDQNTEREIGVLAAYRRILLNSFFSHEKRTPIDQEINFLKAELEKIDNDKLIEHIRDEYSGWYLFQGTKTFEYENIKMDNVEEFHEGGSFKEEVKDFVEGRYKAVFSKKSFSSGKATVVISAKSKNIPTNEKNIQLLKKKIEELLAEKKELEQSKNDLISMNETLNVRLLSLENDQKMTAPRIEQQIKEFESKINDFKQRSIEIEKDIKNKNELLVKIKADISVNYSLYDTFYNIAKLLYEKDQLGSTFIENFSFLRDIFRKNCKLIGIDNINNLESKYMAPNNFVLTLDTTSNVLTHNEKKWKLFHINNKNDLEQINVNEIPGLSDKLKCLHFSLENINNNHDQKEVEDIKNTLILWKIRYFLERIEIKDQIKQMSKNNDNRNSHFLCPISGRIMEDPVSASCGHSFDRLSIFENINYKNKIEFLCPVKDCNSLIKTTELKQNIALKEAIKVTNKIDSGSREPQDKKEILAQYVKLRDEIKNREIELNKLKNDFRVFQISNPTILNIWKTIERWAGYPDLIEEDKDKRTIEKNKILEDRAKLFGFIISQRNENENSNLLFQEIAYQIDNTSNDLLKRKGLKNSSSIKEILAMHFFATIQETSIFSDKMSMDANFAITTIVTALVKILSITIVILPKEEPLLIIRHPNPIDVFYFGYDGSCYYTLKKENNELNNAVEKMDDYIQKILPLPISDEEKTMCSMFTFFYHSPNTQQSHDSKSEMGNKDIHDKLVADQIQKSNVMH